MSRDLKNQVSSRCIHFTGIMNEKCDAGVCYKDVRVKPKDGGMYQFPCIKTGGHCDKCKFKSEAEVQEELNEIEELSERMVIVYSLIKSDTRKQGDIDCTCGGKVKFVKASGNSHIWCKCNTCKLGFNE